MSQIVAALALGAALTHASSSLPSIYQKQVTATKRAIDVLNPFNDKGVYIQADLGAATNLNLKPLVNAAELALVAGAAGSTALGGSVIKSVASSFGKASLGTKVVVGGVIAPVAAVAIVKNPSNAVTASSNYGEFVNDASTFIANPSMSTGEDLVKNSPYISGAIAVAGLGTGTYGLLKLGDIIATKQNTNAILSGGSGSPLPISNDHITKEQVKLAGKQLEEETKLAKQKQKDDKELSLKKLQSDEKIALAGTKQLGDQKPISPTDVPTNQIVSNPQKSTRVAKPRRREKPKPVPAARVTVNNINLLALGRRNEWS